MGAGHQRSRGTMSRLRALGLAIGVTTTVVAWGVLVFAAIDFGRSARAGQTDEWVFLGLATVGAVACMFLAILLASKMQTLLRGDPTRPHPPHSQRHSGPPRPKSTSGAGKRAAR